jgi:prepilin-type N-terminal cleavage/methylation domain-containing protein
MPKNKGFTLVEMLVVISLFAGLAVLVGTMVGSSMKATKKSESAVKVRAELENAAAVVERSLRGAKKGTVNCNNNIVNFTDQDDISVSFSCSGNPLSIQKNGVNLISISNIELTNCNFDCSRLSTSGVVILNLSGTSKNSVGVESDIATVSARIVLRNY